jgi:choline dehydrogenase
MMPLELGGVVDEDLTVYGIEQLSIVDSSIVPLLVGATLQGTVYAVAEKVRTIHSLG